MFSTNLAEWTLFWFCFKYFDFRHILVSKYLALNNLTRKTFCMEMYCNFSYKNFLLSMGTMGIYVFPMIIHSSSFLI